MNTLSHETTLGLLVVGLVLAEGIRSYARYLILGEPGAIIAAYAGQPYSSRTVAVYNIARAARVAFAVLAALSLVLNVIRFIKA